MKREQQRRFKKIKSELISVLKNVNVESFDVENGFFTVEDYGITTRNSNGSLTITINGYYKR